MKDNMKFSLKITGQVTLLCLAAFLVFGIQIAVVGSGKEQMLMMNPFISGFLHAGVTHFLLNIVLIFLAMLAPINRSYNIEKIFWITTLLSILYLPVPLSGATLPAIGISGTCYFFLARYFFTWKNRHKLGVSIILLFAFAELVAIPHLEDNTAHGVHLMGIPLGYLSLSPKLHKIMPNWLYLKVA